MPSWGFGGNDEEEDKTRGFALRPWRPLAPLPTLSGSEFQEQAAAASSADAWHRLKAGWQRNPLRDDDRDEWSRLSRALYDNPLASQFDTETSSGRPGAFGRIKNVVRSVTARDDRVAMGKIAAFVGLASALGAASAGGGAGAGAGGGLSAGEAAAAGVDPFVAGGGISAGAGGAAAASGGAAGWIDPFMAGGGLGSGTAGLPAAAGGGMNPIWESLLKQGGGMLLGKALNGQQAPGKDLSRSPYESGDLQRYLPPELRAGTTGPLIGAGVQGIGELLRNPGGLSPSVLDAIRPRLAEESQSIAQNYRGLQANQAGAAARGNTPMSIKGALASALDVAQERAQRSARNEALTASDTMRRGDLEQVYQLLNAILAFQQAGRGTATAGIGAGTALQSQQNAAMMALIGSLMQPQQQGG